LFSVMAKGSRMSIEGTIENGGFLGVFKAALLPKCQHRHDWTDIT
jgi:hypothetical protein